LASSWIITPSGSAASSGELLFRVAPAGGESMRVAVPVRSGSDDMTIAREIRQALSARLGRTYKVEQGEGANVLVSDSRGKPSFSIDLLDSPVVGLRVSVRNIEPAATPTVPSQSTPATTPPPPTPAQPGAAAPPTESPAEAMPPTSTPAIISPPASPPPSQNPPGPTSPVTTAPGDNSQPSAPPPGGTPSRPPDSAPPAVPPNATPPPKS
jgi:hypothetical protein